MSTHCEHCAATVGLELEVSRTAYEEAERNRPLLLCRECAAVHHAYWDEMWEDLYRNCM
jgi:hypothetical protein